MNDQPTTYKGAFIGVNGDFNLKLQQLQEKLGGEKSLPIHSARDRKFSDQTYDLANNNGRRNYMNKLGIISKIVLRTTSRVPTVQKFLGINFEYRFRLWRRRQEFGKFSTSYE